MKAGRLETLFLLDFVRSREELREPIDRVQAVRVLVANFVFLMRCDYVPPPPVDAPIDVRTQTGQRDAALAELVMAHDETGELRRAVEQIVDGLIEDGLLTVDGGRLYLTPLGRAEIAVLQPGRGGSNAS